MPVEWRDTSAALDRIVAKAVAAAKRIEADGAKLVQAAMMLRAPHRSGALRGGISVGVYKGHAAVGPTGVYARRISLGYHGRDSLGRLYKESGNPYAGGADRDSAELVHELAVKRWTAATRR